MTLRKAIERVCQRSWHFDGCVISVGQACDCGLHAAKQFLDAFVERLEGLEREWRSSAEWMTTEIPHGYQSGRIGQLKECADAIKLLREGTK